MMFLKAGLILTCVSSLPARADFSIQTDILPFGWPVGVGGLSAPETSTLSRSELAGCISRYSELVQLEAETGVERAGLLAYEAELHFEKSRRTSPVTKSADETDTQLDEIEAALKAEDPGLEQRIVSYLRKRQDYFHPFSEFAQACGTKAYRLEDLRSFITK